MTTTEKTKDRFPDAVYAAAGVGELAYQQLRKLPAATAELREQLPTRLAELRTELPAKVAELRSELPAKAAELRSELPAKAAELRTEIPAALSTLVADAFTAYRRMVKRGRKVVDGRDIHATLTPAPLPEGVEAKPVVEPIGMDTPTPQLDVAPANPALNGAEAKPVKKSAPVKRAKPADEN